MKKLSCVMILAGLAALSFSSGPAVATNLTFPGVTASKLLADLEGKWEFTMTPTERQSISGVLTVKRGNGPAGYEGSILINELQHEAPTKITKAEVKGDKFLYAGEVNLEGGTYIFEMTGTIKDGKLDGQTKVQEPDSLVVYKLLATRK